MKISGELHWMIDKRTWQFLQNRLAACPMVNSENSYLVNTARILFLLSLVFTCVMATLPHPPQGLFASDKANHMMAFAVLTALHNVGYRHFGVWRRILVMTLVGGTIEVVQSIPSLHRDAEWVDWFADIVATLMASLAVHFFATSRGQR